MVSTVSTKSLAEPTDSRKGHVLLPVSVLLAGLLVTALAAWYAKANGEKAEKREFDFVCIELQARIADRLSAHEQILLSAAAFFEDSDGVTRQEWKLYSAHQKIDLHLPGIQGLGFSLLIPREKLAQHIQEVRAEGYPDYQVRPEGDRELYTSIIYLEPFEGRNLRAFGYDMLNEPVRRAAMERARDQDEASLSGKVRLVQETDQDIQAGTLMYVPVYGRGMPTDTVDQRRAAIRGWVYSPYRMTDLMHGILGKSDLLFARPIHLKIFDGESTNPAALLYDSQPAATRPAEDATRLNLQWRVVAAGRPWTLNCTMNDRPIASIVWLVMVGGMILSLSLVGLVSHLLSTRSEISD
jgi:CHASE1-domain containing sensor protein